MEIKINDVEIAVYPSEFSVTTLDLDDGESTVRTADGTLNRDRVAVKRQLELSWGMLTWPEISSILQAISPIFFDVSYPDPMIGAQATKTFYAGNRPAPFALKDSSGNVMWSGLKVTLIER